MGYPCVPGRREGPALAPHKKVSDRTKTEVNRKLADLRREMESGLTVPNDRLTVAAFLARWLTQNIPGHVADSDVVSKSVSKASPR